MKIFELLSETRSQILYHGTLKEFVPDIMDLGLLPQVGKFTAHAYQEYAEHGIPLDNVVFAADLSGLKKCVSAIVGQMRHHYSQFAQNKIMTEKDFFDHAALLVIKTGKKRFEYHGGKWDEIHPPQVEPQDYYTRGADLPDMVLTNERLKKLLDRVKIDLSLWGIRRVEASNL